MSNNIIENALKFVTHTAYTIEVVLLSDYHSNKSADASTAAKRTSDKKNKKSNTDEYRLAINNRYTFDHFIVGENNRFAHAAAVAVAEDPANVYNPLFLYASSGLGKTHLMQAIANHILEMYPEKQVLYVTSETFINEYINAIQTQSYESFRSKYRNSDVLLIDDVHFIAGKEKSQEEFFHTFNALYNSEKQIILSSDKAPRDLNQAFEDRIINRFEWGLTADITPPLVETRLAILRNKAELKKFNVSDTILSYIAENVTSNIRDLEGVLNKIIAYISLHSGKMTDEAILDVLKEMLVVNRKRDIDCKGIIQHVSRFFDISVLDVLSKKRSKEITFPRHIAMYLCRTLTECSFPQVGDYFGGRDHTTVMHAYNKIHADYDKDSETRRVVDELNEIICGV